MGNEQRALVIEDDFDIAEIFRQALEKAGFETQVILDGAEALHHLRSIAGDSTKSVPDVIALDLHLPGASGMDILRAIRADERLSAMRVILTTADQVSAQSVRADADLVLLKPISFGQLQILAKRIVEKPRAGSDQ